MFNDNCFRVFSYVFFNFLGCREGHIGIGVKRTSVLETHHTWPFVVRIWPSLG